MRFLNRVEAGRRLADALVPMRRENPVVLALPRGGVPVGCEVATALGAPLDVIVVRKLGVPTQPELGMGALGEGGVRVINHDVVGKAGVTAKEIAAVEAREGAKLERRATGLRQGRPLVPIAGRTVIIVDDGIATGSTAHAACEVARARGAARVVLATPVAPSGWTAKLEGSADDFVCLSTPDPFVAVGQFYRTFPQVSDAEVLACLERVAGRRRRAPDAPVSEGVGLPPGRRARRFSMWTPARFDSSGDR